MTDFIIKKLPYDLTSNAGLALVGQYTKRLGINALVDRKFPVAVGGIPNSDILKAYLGLLVQGKNDFDAIEEEKSIARIQPHGGRCCTGLGPPNAVDLLSLSACSGATASGLSTLWLGHGSVRIFVFEARGVGLIHAVVRLWLTCWPFKAKGTLST